MLRLKFQKTPRLSLISGLGYEVLGGSSHRHVSFQKGPRAETWKKGLDDIGIG